MIRIAPFKRILSSGVFISCLLFATLQLGSSGPQDAAKVERNRGRVLYEIAVVRENLKKDPSDDRARLELAKGLYQAGSIAESRQALEPLLAASKPSLEAVFLGAEIEYLKGNYGRAEALLEKAMVLKPKDDDVQFKAQTKLVYAYYQTNEFARAQGLFKGLESRVKLPYWDLLKAFGQEKPYGIAWSGGAQKTEVPFLITDPLPVISVEVQGRQIYAFIDTGADTFVLDPDAAAALGIKPLVSMTGTFAGGKKAEVGLGKVDSLKIGDVTMTSVPIALLPTARFSEGLTGGKYALGGIVGTGVLKQFLSTIDYVNSRLTLRPRTEASRSALRADLKGRTIVEMPFVMASTHFILTWGSLNDKQDLVFFVDSGLASEAAFAAPNATLEYAGIEIPETKVREGNMGGGGGAGFATGQFPIRELALGPLTQKNLKGSYGVAPPTAYWGLGFIEDGLISHQFLRRYSWTIDFADMTMIFALK
jgi:hypothetical protein